MIHQLARYARAAGLVTEPGFAPRAVRWCLHLASDGRFLGALELGDAGAKNNLGVDFPMCPDLSQPELVATKGCHFLVEAAAVVALLGAEDGDDKAARKHEHFIRLLDDAGSAVPALTTAAVALRDERIAADAREALRGLGAKPTDRVTLRLGTEFPVAGDAWHAWWRDYRRSIHAEDAGPGSGGRSLCLLTGEPVVPAVTHPKIQGLADVGGQSMGSPLVGYDKDAFTSFGLAQSANGAMSEESAATYRAALNDLLRRRARRLAGTKVACWFHEAVPEEDDPLPWLEDPSGAEGDESQRADAERRARDLLDSIHAGRRPDLARNRYFALTLSGAAGRVMVRDWMEGAFEDLVASVGAWFADLRIVRRDGGGLAPDPKFMAVLGATVRSLDDLPAPFVASMWRAALRNSAIPESAFAQALHRFRSDVIADTPSSHSRMGLLKAYLLRRQRAKGGADMTDDLGPYVNENHPSPAYQCGRLMAVLARLQRSALGDVGAGVVQRYYAAASCTPALVLGRLVRTSQHHIAKLEGGLGHWYEAILADVHTKLGDGPPRILDLEGQSLFALGYYQQIAQMNAKRRSGDDEAPDTNAEGTDETR